jgi:hypothetical protein
MSTIYIVEPGGQQTPYSEEQALALASQGRISSQALYWKEGMPEWRPAAEFFHLQGTGLGSPAVIPTRVQAQGFAKDPTRLTGFLKVMLWISAGFALAGAVFTAISLATGSAAKAPDDTFHLKDAAEALIAVLRLLVFILTGITFLRWIHRANYNSRSFGAQGMQFTPAWSVGWYFIPIANLWKPYRAMKEIWQASQNPESWSTQAIAPVVSNWWSLWLATNFLGQLSFRLTFRAETASTRISAAGADLLSDLADIGLCIVAIRLVTAVYRNQLQLAQRRAILP